ncbi:hypothetical protein LHYA1_G002859 [Lachnellula hyalina]|uniref:Fungal N-terminal domain-containing protein n=1 Tax=Lachnellula hyalina TaxID=1316788 RepID=A0A8H8R4H1_9HELO|nr:uncharacterized protein LHYA1_G002859 [Lachnellula hyalina]TVY28427.1 hypothetical protein LHYA1_G002859 [Lachnellula hyalina]
MADAILGIVAGGIGIASLAIQLVEVAQKLHSFWDTLETANSNIERIKDHLLLMQTISNSIVDIANQEPNINCEESVTRSLDICKIRTRNLEKQINSGVLNGAGRKSKRGLSSFKTALKDKTIQNIESQLRGNVMMLLVSLQLFFHHVQSQKLNYLSSRISHLSVPLVSHHDLAGIPEAYKLLNVDSKPLSESKNSSEAPSKSIHRNGRIELSRREHRRAFIKLDIYTFLKKLSSTLGISLHPIWKMFQLKYAFGVTYTSVEFSNYNRSVYFEDALYSNIKRRLKVILPIASFQIQTSSTPWSLTSYPITPCQSQIFTICADGNIDTVKQWFKNSWVSPFVVNQHGKNLLHHSIEDRRKGLRGYSRQSTRVQIQRPTTPKAGRTLLDDAPFNFGWWTQLCHDDQAVSWQSIYLLRSGANSHARTLEGDLTPLDTFMRGCTAHSVDHATKWPQALSESGVVLYEYSREEQRLHAPEHYLNSTWDGELWRWIPTKRRVIYKYGNTVSEVAIWLEDYDALSWFQCWRHDLKIFGVLTLSESLLR